MLVCKSSDIPSIPCKERRLAHFSLWLTVRTTYRHSTVVPLHSLVFVFTCIESSTMIALINEARFSGNLPDKNDGLLGFGFGVL